MSYTQNIEKEKTRGGKRLMEATNAKTIETLEREREREP